MNRSKIEWIKNPDGSTPGWTWSPLTGCLGPKGDGVRCPYCYAHKLAKGRLKNIYLHGGASFLAPVPQGKWAEKLADPFYPRYHYRAITEPTYRRKPSGIFVCSMSDLFGEGIPEVWTEQVLWAIKSCPQHRFYLLTKCPQNLSKFSPFPKNCYVGVTVTDAGMFAQACGYLAVVEATVKYLSMEPLLGMIPMTDLSQMVLKMSGVSWIIIGAQTHPLRLPQREWVLDIINAADKDGVSVFCKDNLAKVGLEYLRQEMPSEHKVANIRRERAEFSTAFEKETTLE